MSSAILPKVVASLKQVWLPSVEGDETTSRKNEMIDASSIVYPFVLPKIYASIFMLYALGPIL
jgi:hypothetical protein